MYEYKIIPAPQKGQKVKGVKAPEARFALSIELVLNEMGAAGWEYQRAELLPSEERSGLTGTSTHWRNVLVFRRPLQQAAGEPGPRPSAAAEPFVPAPGVQPAPGETAPRLATGARRDWSGDADTKPVAVAVAPPGKTGTLSAETSTPDKTS